MVVQVLDAGEYGPAGQLSKTAEGALPDARHDIDRVFLCELALLLYPVEEFTTNGQLKGKVVL